MAKGSGRFRNRKLGFKSRIALAIGVDEFEEDPLEELDYEDDKAQKKVETGVDKDEEGEVHLQAVIAASSAAAGARSSSSKPTDRAYIPTPDSTGTIDDAVFRDLYRNGYVDPVTYIRFSDTVEDTTTGAVEYTMDEDDEDWLEAYNAQFKAGANRATTPSSGAPASDDSPNGRSARKGKGEKGRAAAAAAASPQPSAFALDKAEDRSPTEPGPISEDDFERVMEVMEKTTDRKAPMAHVDPSSIPVESDMEAAFTDHLDPSLEPLRPYVRPIYPHWKERRLKRKGRSIIPQLDYDESNENNPYVCFRRRELKTSRKTRRSDAQNIERLIRLRNDLHAAHALMLKTQEREQLKLEAIQIDRKVFDARVEARELKRRLGEAEGDEDILIGRRDKKRRKEEGAQSSGSLRLSLRKPDPSNYTAASITPSVEDLKLRKERAAAINARMERDAQKKREADQMWEDWTDGAYVTRLPPTPARYWRAVEAVHGSVALSGPAGNKLEALGFATQYQPAAGRVRTSFRRRVGRGGRVMLDRISPGIGRATTVRSPPQQSDASEDESEETERAFARRQERFRFDSDASLDFPSVDEPTLIDDFDLKYLLKRTTLLRPSDVETLTVDSSYLDEANRWAAQDPDRQIVPPVVFGRPPPRPAIPAQPGGPGGMPMQVPAGSPANGNGAGGAYGQAQMAAAQALRVAQQQAHLKRQQQGQVANEQMRRTPSQGSPNGQQAQVPMQNGNGPVQAQWNGGLGTPESKNGLILPPGFPPHIQQQLPRLPNGLVASLPNGANGMPATSRLSAPPFSNLQLALQAQQQAQMHQQSPQQHNMPLASSPLPMGLQLHARPQSSNSNHPQQTPSRPGSAQSSHASPNLMTQGLPSPGGPRGPNGQAVNGVMKQGQRSPMAYSMQAGPTAYKQQAMQPQQGFVSG